ncbi:MAG: hypothetical protein ACFFAJ_16820, partial [Candidatus Hodarchaeota archaeon]
MKMKCEATCATCYFPGGRRQEFGENDLLWFCNSCRKFFFCDVGLGRSSRGYSCPFCTGSLVKEEVDKGLIAKGLTPIGQSSSETHEMYHKVMGSSKTKKGFWRRNKKEKKSLTAYEHSQISELGDIEGLTIPLILELARTFKIDNLKNFQKIQSKKDLLSQLAEKHDKIIPFLYSTLFQFESGPNEIQLRFAVFCPNIISNLNRIVLAESSQSKRKYDLSIIDSNDKETWVYCLDEVIDLNNLETLVNKALTIDFKKFPNVLRVFLVARTFSFLARGMIKKYQTILTGIEDEDDLASSELWRSIPIFLFE